MHLHPAVPEKAVEYLLLSLDPGPAGVLHLVRRHTEANADSVASKPEQPQLQNFRQGAGRKFLITFFSDLVTKIKKKKELI